VSRDTAGDVQEASRAPLGSPTGSGRQISPPWAPEVAGTRGGEGDPWAPPKASSLPSLGLRGSHGPGSKGAFPAPRPLRGPILSVYAVQGALFCSQGPKGPKGPFGRAPGPPVGPLGGRNTFCTLTTFKAEGARDDSLKSGSFGDLWGRPAAFVALVRPIWGPCGSPWAARVGGSWPWALPDPSPYRGWYPRPPKEGQFPVDWSLNCRTLGSWLIVGKVG